MIPYFGGKFHQAKWIEEFIPVKYKTYVEPFGGAFWVYIQSQFYKNFDSVVYSDLNPDNTNMYKVFKYKGDELKQKIADNLGKMDLFYDIRDSFFANRHTDVERAFEYIYLMTHVFSGSKLNPNIKIPPKSNDSKYKSLLNKLETKRKHLDSITNIDNADYQDCFNKYDSKETVFYIDPPYKDVAYYTVDSFSTTEDHSNLMKSIKNLKGHFILSYYYFQELEEHFPKDEYNWHEKTYSSSFANGKKEDYNDKVEILITKKTQNLSFSETSLGYFIE